MMALVPIRFNRGLAMYREIMPYTDGRRRFHVVSLNNEFPDVWCMTRAEADNIFNSMIKKRR